MPTICVVPVSMKLASKWRTATIETRRIVAPTAVNTTAVVASAFPALFHGGCKNGPYNWSVTVVDPYYRPDVSRSGSFTARR